MISTYITKLNRFVQFLKAENKWDCIHLLISLNQWSRTTLLIYNFPFESLICLAEHYIKICWFINNLGQQRTEANFIFCILILLGFQHLFRCSSACYILYWIIPTGTQDWQNVRTNENPKWFEANPLPPCVFFYDIWVANDLYVFNFESYFGIHQHQPCVWSQLL